AGRGGRGEGRGTVLQVIDLDAAGRVAEQDGRDAARLVHAEETVLVGLSADARARRHRSHRSEGRAEGIERLERDLTLAVGPDDPGGGRKGAGVERETDARGSGAREERMPRG